MPQSNKGSKPTVDPSLLQKIFGYGKMAPNIEEGIQIAKMEHPNMPTPSRMGILGKVFSPKDALAVTYPHRSISMNEDKLQGYTPQDIADILAHENTHIEQLRNQGVLGSIYRDSQENSIPYYQKPREVEAFRATATRQNNMGRMVEPVPSVLGTYYSPHDVNLPAPGSLQYKIDQAKINQANMNYTRFNPKTGQYERVNR